MKTSIRAAIVMLLLAGCVTGAPNSAVPSASASASASTPPPPVVEPLPTLTEFPAGFATEYTVLGADITWDGESGTQHLTFFTPTKLAGTGTATFVEHRTKGASVTCNGTLYDDPALETLEQTDPPGGTTATIGVATLLLEPNHKVIVFDLTVEFPICKEDTGRYVLTLSEGPTRGVKTGTYRYVGDVLTLG